MVFNNTSIRDDDEGVTSLRFSSWGPRRPPIVDAQNNPAREAFRLRKGFHVRCAAFAVAKHGIVFVGLDAIQIARAPPEPPPFQFDPIEGGLPQSRCVLSHREVHRFPKYSCDKDPCENGPVPYAKGLRRSSHKGVRCFRFQFHHQGSGRTAGCMRPPACQKDLKQELLAGYGREDHRRPEHGEAIQGPDRCFLRFLSRMWPLSVRRRALMNKS